MKFMELADPAGLGELACDTDRKNSKVEDWLVLQAFYGFEFILINFRNFRKFSEIFRTLQFQRKPPKPRI